MRLLLLPLAVLLLVAPALAPVGALPGAPVASMAPWGVWTNEQVAVSETGPSLALDSRGQPHVAYFKWENGARVTRLASSGPLGWTIEDLPFDGVGISLQFDSQDRPHLVYKHIPTSDLRYSYREGGVWMTTILDNHGQPGVISILRLDDHERPHIVYTNGLNDDVRYAHLDQNQVWTIETVGQTPFRLSFGFDLAPDSTPHVAYGYPEGSRAKLFYAVRNSNTGDWQTSLADTDGGAHVSLAVDSQGHPHMAYEGDGMDLRYARHDGTQWVYEVVDARARTGQDTRIAIDSDDRPHIVYYHVQNFGWPDDPTRGHTLYVTKLSTGQWHIERPDPTGRTTRPDLVLDEAGKPRIAYKLLANQIVGVRPVGHLYYSEPIGASALAAAQEDWVGPNLPAGLSAAGLP